MSKQTQRLHKVHRQREKGEKGRGKTERCRREEGKYVSYLSWVQAKAMVTKAGKRECEMTSKRSSRIDLTLGV